MVRDEKESVYKMTFKLDKDKRKNPRADSAFCLECSNPRVKTYFDSVCKDISSGGVKILTDTKLKTGDEMKVNINMVDKVIAVDTKVAWCAKQQTANRYLAGLEITTISDQDKKELTRFLNRIFRS